MTWWRQRPDGNSIIVTAIINMSELDGENWSDEELAYYFKYIYRSDSDVIGASFNDLGFAKITLIQSEDGLPTSISDAAAPMS